MISKREPTLMQPTVPSSDKQTTAFHTTEKRIIFLPSLTIPL